MWNPYDGTIYITIEPGLVSHGLCGNFDNDIENDYLDKKGNCLTDSCAFADSWRTTCPVRPYWKTFSIVGADARHVEFTNNYRDTVYLYWVSVDGTWEKMAEIDQYESATITETYSHVAWIATSVDNTLMHMNGYCVFYPLEVILIMIIIIIGVRNRDSF